MTLPPLPQNLRQQFSLPLDSKDLAVPHFVALYRYLGQNILDYRDASSVAKNKSYDLQGTEVELRERWADRARKSILVRSLREVCERPPADGNSRALQASLREIGLVIAAYLSKDLEYQSSPAASSGLQNNDHVEHLMTGDVNEFKSKMNEIAICLGQHIIECEKTMRQILAVVSTESSPSTTHAASRIPSITSRNKVTSATRKHQTSTPSSDLLKQQLDEYTTSLTHTLPAMLTNLTTTLRTLLQTQTTLLTRQIQHLETSTHSTQSRYLISHATFLATVSKGIALKAQILNLLREKQVYAQEDIRPALKAKYTALQDEESDLAQTERDLKGLLEQYNALPGGEDTLRTLGAEYARTEAEIEDVKKDIERLESQPGDKGIPSGGDASNRTGVGARTRRKK